MQWPHLFSPLSIGPIEVKNRLGFSPNCPVTSGHLVSGLFDEDSAYYYGERAKGGQGLIIIGETRVTPSTVHFPYVAPQLFDDRNVGPLAQIAREVHRHGARLLIQLYAGLPTRSLEPQENSLNDDPDVDLTVAGPSYMPGTKAAGVAAPTGIVLREAPAEELTEIAEAYARAARRAADAGLDGVEIAASASYLPALFLSPRFNRRTDAYGGCMENRARFLVEVLKRVRQRLGTGFVVGYRANCDTLTPGDLTADDMVDIVRYVNGCAQVDYVSSVLGLHTLTLMDTASPGWQMSYTDRIKQACQVPVFGVGGFTHPQLAEEAIARGRCDLVLLARQLFADPEFANKAHEDRADDIRPCVHANYCRGRVIRSLRNECFQNPAQGRERVWGIGTVRPTTQPKGVLVIGGGPAGLEVARVAAQRGHAVVLYERRERVGGHLALEARLPFHAEYGNMIAWYELQLHKLRVQVKTEQQVTPENLQEVMEREGPDAVVLATGSRPGRNGFNSYLFGPVPGWERGNVFTWEDVVEGRLPAQLGYVVLLDDLSTELAPALALHIAPRAQRVHLVTPWATVVSEPHVMVNHEPWVEHLYRRNNIHVTRHAFIKEIGDGFVTLVRCPTGDTWRGEDVSAVVFVTTPHPENHLFPQTRKLAHEAHIIGDAVVPRHSHDSIFEGHRLGRRL